MTTRPWAIGPVTGPASGLDFGTQRPLNYPLAQLKPRCPDPEVLGPISSRGGKHLYLETQLISVAGCPASQGWPCHHQRTPDFRLLFHLPQG